MAKTLQDVRNKIESGDGFEYTFRFYSDFKEVKDTEFHRLRKAFVAAADKLEEYINERTVEGEDY